jgi:hypothetical protein
VSCIVYFKVRPSELIRNESGMTLKFFIISLYRFKSINLVPMPALLMVFNAVEVMNNDCFQNSLRIDFPRETPWHNASEQHQSVSIVDVHNDSVYILLTAGGWTIFLSHFSTTSTIFRVFHSCGWSIL